MNDIKKLSVVEKLLISSFKLEKTGISPFTSEDLVVEAWKNFPDVFGLKGYRDDEGKIMYPNSNRVFAEIMGSKPIRQKGYLKKVGEKIYQLTESGREEALRIIDFLSNKEIKKISLSQKIENELKHLLHTRAFQKAKNMQFDKITFFDACTFWRISPRSSAIEFEGKLANIRNITKTVEEVLKEEEYFTFEHKGKQLGTSDIELIKDINEYLLDKFQAEISIIKTRKDERGRTIYREQ